MPVPDEPNAGPEPSRAPGSTAAAPNLKLVARHEHLLSSLVELSRKLWRLNDVHDVADALLLSLMGQIGTTRSALWLSDETSAGRPVLIRCHGIKRAMAEAIALSSWQDLADRFDGAERLIPPAGVRQGIGRSGVELADQAGVVLFAPLGKDNAAFGLVALGLPPGRDSYNEVEIEVIQASLAIAGLALESAHRHGLDEDGARKLRRANEELLAVDRMKSEFIDHANHEFRTPLAVILGCLECLTTNATVPPDSQVLVQAANQGAQRLNRLIERLLTLSEFSHGTLAVSPKTEDLGEFLTRFHQERRPGISAGFRELLLDCPPGASPARFDARRLKQIMDELVDNAVRFSPAGKAIRIRLSGLIEGEAKWREISVEDEGFGISPERMSQLFLSFRHLDGSLVQPTGGLGIGLAAAKELTEAMGGRIEVTSNEGEGSVFSVVLPAA